MDLADVLKALKESKVDPKDFAKALHEEVPDLYTHLFNAGHSKARGEYDAKLKAKDEELETLQKAINDSKSTIEQLSKSKPDVAEIEEKWKSANNRLAAELEQARTQFSEKEKSLLERVQNVNTERYVKDVVSWMVSKGADPDYAEMKVQKHLDRLDFENQQVVGVRQGDGVTAMPNPSNRPLHELLAREVMATVPPKFIEERRMQGSGLGNGASGNQNFTLDQLKGLSDADFEQNLDSIVAAAEAGNIE